jgi:hypothetical protein
MSLYSDTLSWFRDNHSLFFLPNAACLAEKQQIFVLWLRNRNPFGHWPVFWLFADRVRTIRATVPQLLILQSLVWSDRGSNTRSTALNLKCNPCTTDTGFFYMKLTNVVPFKDCAWNLISLSDILSPGIYICSEMEKLFFY